MQLFGREDVAVLQAQVILLVEEALALHAGHVEHVQLGHNRLEIGRLNVFEVLRLKNLLFDVAGQLQLGGRDQRELHVFIARERGDERMDGAAEFQIAAEANREVVQPSLFALYGQQVGQRLSGVVVAAVARVDDRHVAD